VQLPARSRSFLPPESKTKAESSTAITDWQFSADCGSKLLSCLRMRDLFACKRTTCSGMGCVAYTMVRSASTVVICLLP
jgi:hypothetical protein